MTEKEKKELDELRKRHDEQLKEILEDNPEFRKILLTMMDILKAPEKEQGDD